MKSFITGATGFIGGRVAERLRERGDDVVALVRTPSKAGRLEELGCTLVRGDLLSLDAIREGVRGCDSVFHVAADYRVGVRANERDDMYKANVEGTGIVIDEAVAAGVTRSVYVSTIGYFGNTRHEVVDETFERTDLDWLSAYDETKYLAHKLVDERIAAGAPILIAQPGGVYGPGDQSDLADLILRIRRGKLPALPMGDVGFNFVHVDDVVDGLILIHDKGTLGESYVLGGELTTLRGLVDKISELEGKKAPRSLPSVFVKASVPVAPLVTKMMGLPPNLKELIKAADGVTYWAKHDKAARELGYAPRDLDTGLKQTLAAL